MPLIRLISPAPDPAARLTCPACRWTGRADETHLEHEQMELPAMHGWRDVTRYLCPACAAVVRLAIEEVMI